MQRHIIKAYHNTIELKRKWSKELCPYLQMFVLLQSIEFELLHIILYSFEL